MMCTMMYESSSLKFLSVICNNEVIIFFIPSEFYNTINLIRHCTCNVYCDNKMITYVYITRRGFDRMTTFSLSS